MGYERKVHVYETDLMGIVHHSNYLRFCEEVRVEWCRVNNLLGSGKEGVFGLTVLGTKVKHIRPVRYGDLVKIEIQARAEGVRLYFQYRLTVNGETVCLAETVHCSLDLNFKVKRLNSEIIKCAEKEVWTETWL